MIDELVVRNLGVISDARLEPGPGLTVITGETGTGKTLLLGALRLLLGGEARPDLVGPFGDEAVVEGRFFDADGNEIGTSRRMPRDGRSRAYLDGSVASARALEEKVAGLVEIVGQHDQLSITRPSEARQLVDRMLDEEGRAALAAYRRGWETLTDARAARDRLGGDRAALARELDLVTFQADEIARSGFQPGDDVELNRLSERLRHADEIAGLLEEALARLDTGRDEVGAAVAALRKAARLDPELEQLAEALAGSAAALDDHAHDTRVYAEGMDLDPEQLAAVESRLTLLGELRRKYGNTLEEILAFGAAAERRRTELESLIGRAERIDEEVEAAEKEVSAAASRLREARRRAAAKLSEVAKSHLTDLGFSDPHLEVSVEPADPGPSGADSATILFASDSRLTPGPVASVASGGELSRLVLSLRLAGGMGGTETLVFDEIDAGIGGTTALALGRKLAALATERQVLCVTHLPQVAAFADRHYVVRREGNAATAERIEGEQRVGELSRMLAGLPESERGREAAEELLEMASSR